MKYLKKFNESIDIENDLKSIFSLVILNPDVYKLPFGHYSSIDFNIYIISGDRSEKDDHKFIQELYHQHKILNQVYNLEFFHISANDKDTATIVLYDYIMDLSYNTNVKNYLSKITELKLKTVLPEVVMSRLDSALHGPNNYNRILSKGIDYSNGNSSNLSLFDWIYEKPEDFRKNYDGNS